MADQPESMLRTHDIVDDDVSVPDSQRPENACTQCGRDNPVWLTDSKLWNRVMGGPDATDDPGGFLCPCCFISTAEASGVRPTAWVLSQEQQSSAALQEIRANIEEMELALERGNSLPSYEGFRQIKRRLEELGVRYPTERERTVARERLTWRPRVVQKRGDR